MVYNAMKLFMEVNPQLFDDCSHDYTEMQNNADQVKQARQAKWDRLAELAKSMKSGTAGAQRTVPSGMSAATVPQGLRGASPLRAGDDTDPLRLEQLRLADDVAGGGPGSRQISSVR